MQINPLQRHVQAAEVPFERLAGNTNISQADKVTEVSRQFEAVLLRQILGDAQKKIFASTMNPDSVAGGVYQDMITNQLADSISRSGGFGLARALEKQLQHEFKSNPPATDGGSKV
jgi:Rod binding domain-containing protein